jgi:gamma-glutamyltranspeptidase/glutathione hydrolase
MLAVLARFSVAWTFSLSLAVAGSVPTCADHGMVVTQQAIASNVGRNVLQAGGNAIDATVATAFALAVVHPAAGNIGGGGFIVYRPYNGKNPVAYDFRERAPAAAHAEMWLVDGTYDLIRHHQSHLAVGVPGSVAGLHLAWKDHGTLSWAQLLAPAIRLAKEGFTVTRELANSLGYQLDRMQAYPASIAAFTKEGVPYKPGELFKQADLAKTLQRIADQGPKGFYKGETAAMLAAEMKAHGGMITEQDLKDYHANRREPVRGSYRGHEILSMSPPSSGGIAIVSMLNQLEAYPMAEWGFGSAATLHRYAEVMRRAFADRAQHIGDPDVNPDMPVKRLLSKDYAEKLRSTIDPNKASVSSPDSFAWKSESPETTHFSVVDAERNAVSMTTTLEWSYGSGIVVPGAGFLLNNEMGDFNPAPGLTNANGLIGTQPNLTAPGKRMLSSMTPTIVAKDDKVLLVTGSPGGRTIINTVLQTIVNVIDFGMNAQEAVDAGRVHHQWLPDHLRVETRAFSPDTLTILRSFGHQVVETGNQGVAEVILVDPATNKLEGGTDRRVADGAAAGY